ncbi:MFS transporter [Pacificoceanicola onchidii]|uniref:MFS transporter n=1 Tax=Pacificoceanicola onchidii TaxID=2562685 RepID=UPI0010A5CCD2|nr:MFS transporter [Pacificoceanicola onchidii]
MSRLITPRKSVAAAFILNGALLGCWASRIPDFVDRLSLSESRLGLLLLLLGVGALTSFAVAGKLADRHGAFRVTRWLAAFYLLSLVFIGYSETVPMLAASLFFFGLTHGGMDVAMNTWATEVERRLARPVLSSFHAMWSLGAGLGAAGGYLATSFEAGPGLHFLLSAIVLSAAIMPFLSIEWHSPTRVSLGKEPMFALPSGGLILVGLMALGAGLGEGTAVDWSAVYLRDVLEAEADQATLGFTAFSITMVIMRLSVDRLITRLGRVLVARVSGVFAVVGCLICSATGSWLVALLGFVLMGIGCAAIFPMSYSRAANDPDVPPGQAIASVATLGYGALLLGPPAVGFIAEASSLRVSFLLVAACSVMIVLFASVLKPSSSQL